ncbi:MAG: DegV family protein [Oscillospiraceae bacterium]|nr:DegV family protein [Oscillospiraceae bacterium]
MSGKIILSADSTCDIGPALQQRYDVRFFDSHIQIGEKTYTDRVDISTQEIFRLWREEGILPKTAAITPEDYAAFFRGWVEEGYEVLHINLGSGLSSAHQNCLLVAQELGHIHLVDSASLSTGVGLLVVKAGELLEAGLSAPEAQRELIRLREKSSASFVLDTLEFMAAGGRCGAVAAFGANLLKLKPCIRVDNHNAGLMSVGKKYRGAMEKVLAEYVRDQLSGRDDLDLDHVFITQACSPQSDIELVRAEIQKYAAFKHIHVTDASGTIASHCGPRTLGVLFLTA